MKSLLLPALLMSVESHRLRGRFLDGDMNDNDNNDLTTNTPDNTNNTDDNETLSDYLATHPYYPSHTLSTCLNSKDVPPPEWMTKVGYVEHHLFGGRSECCSNFGFDCHDNDDGDGNNSEQEEPTVLATAASVNHGKNYGGNPNHADSEIDVPPAQLITVQETTTTTSTSTTTTTTTFPTMSCGTSFPTALQCTQLCLDGSCPSGQSCFSSIPCPSPLILEAMGSHVDESVLQLISGAEASGKRVRNVCGSSYDDAESSCREGYTEDFVSCDQGVGYCPKGREICYHGIVCPMEPTGKPTWMPTPRPTVVTERPSEAPLTTMVSYNTPVNNEDVTNNHDATNTGVLVSQETTILQQQQQQEEPLLKKDKTNIVGISIPASLPTTENTPSSSNHNASPYTLDKSTLGTITVASPTCSNGCPPNSLCVSNSASGQLITDEECQPCSNGQTWWPCDVDGLCYCWYHEKGEKIAPALESGVENEMSGEEYYTVCDDILTREVFEIIAPDHRGEYYCFVILFDSIFYVSIGEWLYCHAFFEYCIV